MADQHLVLDLGPGLISFLMAVLLAVPSLLAAYYSYRSNQGIVKANSHLAIALNQSSNPAGESKLTISPLPSSAVKE